MTKSPPVVVIHSLGQALAAAAAAAEVGRPLLLATAPAAAAYLGPAWLAAVVEQARAGVPAADIEGLLDCGDRPGPVLAGLREGLTQLRFTGRKSAAARLLDICAASGAVLHTGPLKSLDLLNCKDPTSVCREWLSRV